MKPSSYNQVVVDLNAIALNYKLISNKVGSTVKILAMVKGDGYGHGMVEVAKCLYDAGCRFFGVAEIQEAVVLRQAGLAGSILVMVGVQSEYYPLYFSHDLTPVVYTYDSLELLSRIANQRNQEIGVHLKIDSGMYRLGCRPDEVPAFISRIKELPYLRLVGIMSHLPCSDEFNSAQTSESLKIFQEAGKSFDEYKNIVSHIANSGGVLNFPDSHEGMVRPGISLYGYYPEGEAGRLRETSTPLKPSMSFTSRVLQVKDVPKGAGVSYGHTFITKRKTRLAVVPVGYEDGYPRSLSNCGEVLIGGHRAKIRGRVCMNLCMVDITDIHPVSGGDEVVLLGTQGNEMITADDLAVAGSTISYEILCMIGNNNERSYIS
jgi:alanine racemase